MKTSAHQQECIDKFNAIGSAQEQMLYFVEAIAEAYPANAPRDRFGRIRGPRNLDKLRLLAVALDIPNGGQDVEDQAGMVARALRHHVMEERA